MIGRVKKGWRLFASGRPGFRFRERYLARKKKRARRSSSGRPARARLVPIVGGAALVVVSALLGWLPVLGWGTAVLGLGMVAGEFYPAAHLMDRLGSQWDGRARTSTAPTSRGWRLPQDRVKSTITNAG